MNATQTVDAFFAAIETLNPEQVAACFTPTARYSNMPHAPAVGRDEIAAMFAPILNRCERARWDVVSRADVGYRAHVERVDRFWIGGREYAIECHGVYLIDAESGLIGEVRDYVDLSLWRDRLGGVLAAPMA